LPETPALKILERLAVWDPEVARSLAQQLLLKENRYFTKGVFEVGVVAILVGRNGCSPDAAAWKWTQETLALVLQAGEEHYSGKISFCALVGSLVGMLFLTAPAGEEGTLLAEAAGVLRRESHDGRAEEIFRFLLFVIQDSVTERAPGWTNKWDALLSLKTCFGFERSCSGITARQQQKNSLDLTRENVNQLANDLLPREGNPLQPPVTAV
jgi:hypothetical protein